MPPAGEGLKRLLLGDDKEHEEKKKEHEKEHEEHEKEHEEKKKSENVGVVYRWVLGFRVVGFSASGSCRWAGSWHRKTLNIRHTMVYISNMVSH